MACLLLRLEEDEAEAPAINGVEPIATEESGC